MVLTARDEEIIAAVADFGILTRAQVARHLRFGSTTRVNAVLLRLTRHGYLQRRLQPTLLGTRRQTYLLGKRGAELIGVSTGSRRSVRAWSDASDLFVEHRLLVNDVRLGFAHCAHVDFALTKWLDEAALRQFNLDFIPDGYGEYCVGEKTFAVFLEADNGTESRTRWREKVAQYVHFAESGRFQTLWNRRFFRVLVVLPSARRLASVSGEIARRTTRIFWLTTREEFASAGPLATIWRRPASLDLQSLIQ